MTFGWFRDLIGLRPVGKVSVHQKKSERGRLQFDTMPDLIYAIGDVHGRLDLLLDLENQIAADCAEHDQQALIIMLGDYVDRGPDSSSIIEHLLDQPSFNATRICLVGNHEETMLAFTKNPGQHMTWLEFGGRETLTSYGLSESEITSSFVKKNRFIHVIDGHIPEEHLRFLTDLPILVAFPRHVFVHAGIRPQVPISKQIDKDLIWIRHDFLDYSGKRDFQVVHGHTRVEEPFVSRSRINVDTGAYLTNRLTAAKFLRGEFAEFLTT